jgi:hypothetical protein
MPAMLLGNALQLCECKFAVHELYCSTKPAGLQVIMSAQISR